MDIPKIEIPALRADGTTQRSVVPVGERAGVLIVDDTPAKLVALGAIVTGMELEIVTANSGEQALRQLLKRDFAVILLDVKMPTMGGFETATLIRSRPRSAHTPIIFVTAEANSEAERFRGYTLGAVDFIYSPIIPEILRAKVQVFVDLFYLQRQVLLHNEHLENLVAQRTAALTEEITERKRAEAALQQELVRHQETARELFDARVWLAETDRQEAVGRLAAGVAHEVKNPLAIIRLGIDYLSKEFARESTQGAVLGKVQQAIMRADSIITDLMQFSRQKSLARHPTQINAVVDNAINLVSHEITVRNIDIVRSYDDSMPPILADPDQLAQVFVNLLSNAAQAIGQGGRIEVVTRSIRLSERDLERDETGTFRIGERVIAAEIRDNGSGVSPANQKKLFEPFFTTKPIGEGTGLGLAVSRNIVIMHEGSINLSNRPEGGASALLMFPVAIEGWANEAADTGGG